MKIIIGADHAGFELKQKIVAHLEEGDHEIVDKGANTYDEEDDYPDFIASVARMVSAHPEEVVGIVIGGSGQGEAILSNRFPHVRAVVFNGQYQPKDERVVPEEIKISREHNNSNILSLGARFLNEEEAVQAVDTWLNTTFSGEPRHIRRIKKLEETVIGKDEKAAIQPMGKTVMTGVIASIIGSLLLRLIGLI